MNSFLKVSILSVLIQNFNTISWSKGSLVSQQDPQLDLVCCFNQLANIPNFDKK